MAAFGTLDPIAIQQWFDNNGNPLAGGKLHFYLSGTDTPSPVYADQSLVTPLANPLVLDAAGRAPMHFLDAVSYKEVLKNAADVTIWTADPVTSPGALRNTQATFAASGTQGNVQVPAGVVTFLTFTNSTLLTVTGFTGGTPGQLLVLRSGQAGQVNLLHAQHSDTGNQLYNFVASGPTSLSGAHGTAVYIYQPPFWVLVSHEQGKWIRVEHSSLTFSGGLAVTAGQLQQCDFQMRGASCLLTMAIYGGTITGTPSVVSVSGLPYEFATTVVGLPTMLQLPAVQTGLLAGNIDTRQINLTPSSGNWAAGSMSLYFQAEFDVK